MDKPYSEADCRTIHYYGSASFTDGSLFLYGYEEGNCLTGNVVMKELREACH
ncbi:unnamed protein product [marine sediment metagenome]|uniref:Uncharacterized protein n=1 Tax=marine sediment metagenome TaxID=412755 RepID=X1SBA1_9ZZZZ